MTMTDTQRTAETLHAHLRWAQQYTTQLLEEIEPIAFPRLPADDVNAAHELYVEGRWRSIVTRSSGLDGTIHFILVGARCDVPTDETVIARLVR